MTTRKSLKGLLLGLVLLLAASALAAEKASLTIYDQVTVSGKQLKPGKYFLQWEGSSSNVQVNITQDKKVVATIPARLVDRDIVPASNTYSTLANQDGSKSLTEIQFGGKKQALDFNSDATAVAGNSK